MPISDATELTLNPDQQRFVESRIATGEFETPAEVVQAGLELLAEETWSIKDLRVALIKGEQSGHSAPLDIEQFLAEMREKSAS